MTNELLSASWPTGTSQFRIMNDLLYVSDKTAALLRYRYMYRYSIVVVLTHVGYKFQYFYCFQFIGQGAFFWCTA
jgi:hypothetical protein